METEKQKVLKKIDELITKRKNEMLRGLPSIHEIDDGIIIRFFTDWDNCSYNDEIKFKKIINDDDSNNSTVFFFLPKGSFFDLKQRFHIGSLTCLTGKINISVNDKTRQLSGYSKFIVDSDEVLGEAIENSYLIASSDRTTWGERTLKYSKNKYGF